MIKELREKLVEVLENELLANHCTFKIGGPARYFFVAKSREDVVNATKVAKKLGLPFFVFGGGSNVLFSDEGFDGLVIKVRSMRCEVQNGGVIVAEAGIALSTLVKVAAEEGLTGLEWAVGIPGTVGGAVRGNAGAYGHAIGEVVENAEVMRFQNSDSRFVIYKKEECKFGYRESIFKHTIKHFDSLENQSEIKYIILKVVLKLAMGDKDKIKEEMEKVLKAREEKIPIEPSAGSFFKNVEVTDEIIKTIKEYAHEDVPADYITKGKIPAGWLIDLCDLRGKQIGGAKISKKHANFIVNVGGATAADVITLASLVKMKVRDEVGVQLEEEVEYVGF